MNQAVKFYCVDTCSTKISDTQLKALLAHSESYNSIFVHVRNETAHLIKNQSQSPLSCPGMTEYRGAVGGGGR